MVIRLRVLCIFMVSNLKKPSIMPSNLVVLGKSLAEQRSLRMDTSVCVGLKKNVTMSALCMHTLQSVYNTALTLPLVWKAFICVCFTHKGEGKSMDLESPNSRKFKWNSVKTGSSVFCVDFANDFWVIAIFHWMHRKFCGEQK